MAIRRKRTSRICKRGVRKGTRVCRKKSGPKSKRRRRTKSRRRRMKRRKGRKSRRIKRRRTKSKKLKNTNTKRKSKRKMVNYKKNKRLRSKRKHTGIVKRKYRMYQELHIQPKKEQERIEKKEERIGNTIFTKAKIYSYILESIRDALGQEHIRNKIIKNKIHPTQNIKIGETIGGLWEEKTLVDYLNTLTTDNDNIYLFTVSSKPDVGWGSHFQTFIVDNTVQPKILFIIDSGRTIGDEKDPTWEALDSEKIIENFFSKKGYKLIKNKDKKPQQSRIDVFCQTWSLIMQIEYIKNYLSTKSFDTLPIPTKKLEKYLFLKKWIHQNVPLMEDQLFISYKFIIKGIYDEDDKKDYLKLKKKRFLELVYEIPLVMYSHGPKED